MQSMEHPERPYHRSTRPKPQTRINQTPTRVRHHLASVETVAPSSEGTVVERMTGQPGEDIIWKYEHKAAGCKK